MTSSMPPAGPGPEYLEQGGGARLRREPRERGGGRRRAVLAGATVVGLAAVGGGVWAATSFFATGAQPAEALPASTTMGYASIDLDPSGGQKIEAFEMLRKFPAFREEVGLDAQDDIKKWIFGRAGLSEHCPGVTYADDLEPWLGDRAAIAAVDTGAETPTPVVVVQVTDADAAGEALAVIRACDGEKGGWTIEGGWAVLAETRALARRVSDDAANGSLADDATYQQWTGEAGDAGVLNLYAAPAAGDYLAENPGSLGFLLGESTGAGAAGVSASEPEVPSGPPLPDEIAEGLRNFQGMAATLRFDDGALELEAAGESALVQQSYSATDRGDDVLATLPDDTAAAFGIGLQEGWAQRALDYFASSFGAGESVEEMVRAAEAETGLSLPEDLETLLGSSTAVAVGSDFDPEALFMSSDGGDLPVGVKVAGDPAEVEAVLDKMRAKLGDTEATLLSSASDGDAVAFGPNPDYLDRIVGDGDLGDSEVFRNVVREADRAGAIVFVNFDAGGGWLDTLADGDQEAAENLRPLEGFGVSVWQDGDTAHGMVRLTTD